jgi:hypothetical protein
MPHCLVLALTLAGCGALHLPSIYVRGTLAVAAPSAGPTDVASVEVGLTGRLDAPPPPLPEPVAAPELTPSSPCRIALACAWERRAAAEARARVIGGGP